MKIGVYYPSGHSTFERAVDYFRQNLAKVADDNPFVRFTVKDNQLYLQNINLDTSLLFVREFRNILTSIGIRHLDIDRDILPDETQKFVRSLLVYRAKYQSTRTFTQLNIEDLPPTVRIAQVEYLSSEVQTEKSLDTGDPTKQTMEVFLESLAKQGLTGNQRDHCRQLLEIVMHNPDLSANGGRNLPRITWSDIERLLLSLVGRNQDVPGRDSMKSQQNLNALASILSSLTEKHSDHPSDGGGAIDLLISLVKKNNSEGRALQGPDGKKSANERSRKQRSVFEIQHFVEENSTPRIFEKYLLRQHRCEILTITLQLIEQPLPLQLKYRLEQTLRDVLTGPVQDIEWETVVGGLHNLLRSKEHSGLDVNLMMIINPLRRSAYSSPLYLLKQVCRRCNPAELNRLLPYVLNELLITDKQAYNEVHAELCEMILYLSNSEIQAAIPALEKLDALAEQNIVQNLFFSMPAKFYPIFALLKDSSAKVLLARRALQAFMNNPSDWLIDALLPVFDLTDVLHMEFLYEYLALGAFQEPTNKVKKLAGQIVAEALSGLSQDRRQEPSILRAIRVMPRLNGEKVRQVLKDIATKKYLFIIPDWPLNCRKAAREALVVLDKSVRPTFS